MLNAPRSAKRASTPVKASRIPPSIFQPPVLFFMKKARDVIRIERSQDRPVALDEVVDAKRAVQAEPKVNN